MLWFLLALVFCTVCATKPSSNKTDTLLLLHVVARHGNRTPDPTSTYEHDPYKHFYFHPWGPAGLIQKGKELMYNVGDVLRQRYDSFLGPIYVYNEVDAISSALPRCKASMQALLTTLYPVPGQTGCREGQLVDFKYTDVERDQMITSYVSCPKYYDVEVKYQHHMCSYNDKITMILKTDLGFETVRPVDLYHIYDTIKTQVSLGLQVPKWAQTVWKQPLLDCALNWWWGLMDDQEILSDMIGNMIKKIINDTKRKLSDPSDKTKIHVYVGHDINVGALLGVLNCFNGKDIIFGEYLIFEVHRIAGTVGFKVFHENYSSSGPVLLDIPNCGTFCPLNKLIALTGKYFPREWCK